MYMPSVLSRDSVEAYISLLLFINCSHTASKALETQRLWIVTPKRCLGCGHRWHWFNCAAHQKGSSFVILLSSQTLCFKFQPLFTTKKLVRVERPLLVGVIYRMMKVCKKAKTELLKYCVLGKMCPLMMTFIHLHPHFISGHIILFLVFLKPSKAKVKPDSKIFNRTKRRKTF